MISLPGGEFEEREVKGWIIFTAMWAYEVSDSGLCERHTTRPQYHFRISGLKMQISFYDFHFIISFGLGGFIIWLSNYSTINLSLNYLVNICLFSNFPLF